MPMLLSVGYAACHWCHVMAHESFEDEATAAYLNEHFVSIKVDREERPDVDAVYMSATTAMTGHGGWPMTCVLDHDGNPFFAGTYFPDQPRHGQPCFRQVLAALTEAWREPQRGGTAGGGNAARAPAPAAGRGGSAGRRREPWTRAVDVLARELDPQRGGFGGAPKFPPSMVLEFLLRHGSEPATAMAGATLEAMARGGIHDQLGGGFARYSVDADWVVPHFEKMLYDNALLLGVYARWDTDLRRRAAEGIADFLLGELRTAEGGFASALDADSEGAEGTYYVWTPAQLTEVLGAEDGAWAADLLGVTEAGTFEHGTSTLQLRADPDDLERWSDVQRRLRAARDRRVRPARDDKVVAAWNGLAISGLCSRGHAARTGLRTSRRRSRPATCCGACTWSTGDSAGYRATASSVRRPVCSRTTAASRRASSTCCRRPATPVWLGSRRARCSTRRLTHFARRRRWLLRHRRRCRGAGGPAARPVRQRLAERAVVDGSRAGRPYAALTGSGRHRDAAEAALATVAAIAERAPRFAGWSLAAAQSMLDGPEEVAVVGPAGPERDALARRAPGTPGAVVVVADGPRDDVPLLVGRDAGRRAPGGVRVPHFVCERPVTDPAAL